MNQNTQAASAPSNAHLISGATLSDLSLSGEALDNAALDMVLPILKQKMKKSREKGRDGWEDKDAYPIEQLSSDMVNHIPKCDPCDVAIYAMMAIARGEEIHKSAMDGAKQYYRKELASELLRLPVISEATVLEYLEKNGLIEG